MVPSQTRWATLLILLHLTILLAKATAPHFLVSDHDEAINFGAGALIRHSGQVATMPATAHPPLTFYLNSLLIGSDPVDWSRLTDWFEVARRTGERENLHFVNTIGWDILWQAESEGRNVSWLLFRGRLPFILLSAAFAWFLFAFLRRFHPETALTALALYALSPLVLFTAPGLMTDLTATFFLSLAVIAFAFWSEQPTWRWAALGGVLSGIAVGSKASAIALFAVFLLAAFRAVLRSGDDRAVLFRRAATGFSLGCLTAFLTLWAIYGFQVDSIKNVEGPHRGLDARLWQAWGKEPPIPRIQKNYPQLYEMKIPAVSFYMPIRTIVLRRNDVGERATIEGPFASLRESKLYPWAVLITYFPFMFFALLSSALWVLIRNRRRIDFRSKWIIVAAWPLLYSLAAFTSNYFYGARHLFPIFPLLLVLAAIAIGRLASPKFVRILLITTICLTAVEAILYLITNHAWSLWIYPTTLL